MTNEELNNLQAEAYDHLWNGRFRLALNSALKLFEFRPDDSETAVIAAWAFLENGNPSKALEFANLAVELKGDSSRIRFFRAYLLARMSIYEGSLADIEKNISKEKELLSWTYLTEARALAGMKRFNEAIQSIDNSLLLHDGSDNQLLETKKFLLKSKKYFDDSFSITTENITSLIDDAKNALQAKEYWFSQLMAKKIQDSNKLKKEKEEVELIELESMFYLFQYRPAWQKALALKSQFKENQKFKFIFDSLNKFILSEQEEYDKSLIVPRKTKTDSYYEQSDRILTSTQKHECNTNVLFYPNDYASLFSIKMFDAFKDSKQQIRNYFNQFNKKFPSLGTEVIFNNPFFEKEDKSFSGYVVWYLNDYEIGSNNFRLNIPKEWDSVVFSQILTIDPKIKLDYGQGKVEIYLNNFKVGTKYFGIGFNYIPDEEETKRLLPKTKPILKDEKIDLSVTRTEQKVESKSLDDLLTELDSFIGLSNIKQTVRDFIAYIKFINERKKYGLKTDEKISINAVFLGNPGTGKTTVARLLGNILKAMGILPSGHVIEVDRAGLVGQYIGETAQKTDKLITDSIGGVLFIDEAYTLIKKGGSGQDFGQEAIDVLLKRMEDKKGQFVVISAGYTEEMNTFLNSNPGLKSRFTHTFLFEDYTPDELISILKLYIKKEEYFISEAAQDLLKKEFIKLYRARDKSFGNARLVRNIFDEAKLNLGKRVVALSQKEKTKETLNTISEEDIKQILKQTVSKQFALSINEEVLKESLSELNNLVGLESVKKEINDLVKLARFFAEQGEDLREKFGNHYLFLGNPGTGKTTVARIFSKIFSALGILSKGHLVETDRQGLVAGYVGQTAEKTALLIDKALGGTFFIDEAYALVKTDGSGSDFGKEAIDILLKRMEDDRSKFIVIAAGYTDEMKKFISSNPGMQSRFSKSITFEDYSPTELMEIVYRNIEKEKKVLHKDAKELLNQHFSQLYQNRDKKFGNARIVRNLIESVKQKMLLRIADIPIGERTNDTMNTVLLDDIKSAIEIKTLAEEYQVKGDPIKLQEQIDQLNSLVGIENVKEGIFKLISGFKIAQLKRERGLHIVDKNFNAIFVGNDGTGKTTVAKILSRIMKELGFLEKGHFIKVTRSDLIGAYYEQTIAKTENALKDAIGGTLFFEDVFTLLKEENDKGLAVLDTIMRRIESYKEKILFIFEGPHHNISSLIKNYPIINDKFPFKFEFSDYGPRQLLSIAFNIANHHGYFLDEGALQVMLEIFSELNEKKDLSFYNSKAAKSILYSAISNQEQRIINLINPTDEDLRTITLEDVQSVKY